jgi:hypothetical protein
MSPTAIDFNQATRVFWRVKKFIDQFYTLCFLTPTPSRFLRTNGSKVVDVI